MGGLTDWQPRYRNPSAELNQTFQRGAARAGLFVAYYGNSDRERKLVSSDADSVAITIPPRIFAGLPRPEVVAARVRAVLDVLKAAVPDNQKDGTYIVRAIALCVLVVLLAFLMAHRSTG